MAFLLGALAFEHNTLEFFEDDELFVGMVNLGVTLFFRYKEAGFFKALQLTLDVTCVFFDKLGKAAHVGLKVRILSIDNNNLAANSAGDENV